MTSEAIGVVDKIGIVCIVIVAYYLLKSLAKSLYYNFLGPKLKINAINAKEAGKWAVITGSTDGIGKAFAEALAKKNLNIVLISRSQEKLENVAGEIRSKYNVETKTIAADFTDLNIYYNIDKQLNELDIGVLVNNVGISYPYPEYFLELKKKDEVYENIIKCNIISVTNMCKIVLPGMVDRKRGIVINISSMSAQVPSQFLTVYAASKSFVDKFSRDLGNEYSNFGITIQCLLPGYVATNMSKIKQSTWMAPSPKVYVRAALSSLGIQSRTNGYFPHTLLVQIYGVLESISPKLAKWIVTKMMLNIRARALRRQANRS